MNNIIAMPMMIPILAGILLIFFRHNLKLQRWGSFSVMIVNIGISAYILHQIQQNGILRLDFGGWEPPFGILFVADSFSMLLVLTTSIVAAICLVYAFSSTEKSYEHMFFYPFINFLVAGVNGSFLTGDLFNLFVCFEIMLLASYVLIAFGGRKGQLRESIKYVIINVVSSWIFLIAIAYTYGGLGTLNFAHLSERIAEQGQTPMLTVVSIVFLIVFALKAGLLLFFWLPGSYSVPSTAIAALFGALLTKVGIYAMFRVFTLMFYHEPHITHTFIGILAGVTLILGSIGAVAYKDVRLIASYNVVIAVGFILVGLAVATPTALEGSIFYLIHDMIVKALLFLLAGTMIAVTRETRIDYMSGLIRNYPLFGWIFFIVTLALAGIPPLSGFIGKVLVGQGAVEGGAYILLALAFISSIFVLYSLMRVFLTSFWGETIISKEDKIPMKKGWIIPCVILAAGSFILGIGVEPLTVYVKDAAEVLANPQIYIDAVLYDN
ncbi:Na+/H+ antiporter subunit D [Oceanobacillus kimchii]|uniref:Na+/H+ antiporter subunit D n=1 Tax=Oceanobacillus kimchii TaxID=746691 RepID=A0ABQ5TPQ7_9BACI|nr:MULTISPECIES: Na+/H+ antiporter subunit D [Oceanobacillus]MBT2599571.1 Na+/H+ antiporter subunit D [Oceanobacillus sp. ISL-74]MCT1576756.1 Na+/H+ antiporter subunit D [Oceanobacillus kimchii]MCT2134826.1 Na+/H+ antiporter subunit D [Oceanobacillus kimchii]OEH56121.1 cation:proton antiporter [Oceanobacillus sp. E9]GLO67796.1 Na+/H+ antiporter subunit D [Oceanobacillus kimchii]